MAANTKPWVKNVTFVMLCLLGFSAIGVRLLRRNRVEPPRGVIPLAAESDEFRDVVAKIDGEFRQQWETLSVQPAARADDQAIARRLSLALTGTVPSIEELRAWDQIQEDRIAWWLAHLMEDRRYADYVGERLARAYVGTEEGQFLLFRRRRFVHWLSDQLLQNRAYDQIVQKLIADTGIWTSKPATNFVTVTLDDTEDQQPEVKNLAARTTRAFLGMRIDCLQCHDDHLNRVDLGTGADEQFGQQSHFHQLAAFFAPARTSLTGIRDDEKRSYRYQYLYHETDDEIPPAVPFLPELLPADGSLRERLAAWVTHRDNRPFARATVNRVWALLFGKPLVEPVDDIRLRGPFPPALETLAADFSSHGFDLQRLIRMIVALNVYQLDSRAEFEVQPLHEETWAVFPMTRLRPEQVAGAIIQACSMRTIDANAHIAIQLARFTQQNDFIQRYGDMGEDEFDDRGGTITQRLLMMNGELVHEQTKSTPLLNAASKIAQLAPDDRTAVETAYLAVLTRSPTAAEATRFVGHLAGSRGADRATQLEDLYWILLNSTEFSWNH